MEPVNIHIATQSKFIRYFIWLTKLFGAVYSVETARHQDLRSVIEKGEKDIAEGRGTIMTIDELRKLTNEIA